jgi:hypothetical protein
VNKINPMIAALDRCALRVGLNMVERGNTRCFEYGPTRRWIEYKPGGAGLVKVTSYSARGGNVEAEQYRTEEQMIALLYRATLPFNDPED